MAWLNRLVGHGEEAPDRLLANPRNWRVHPGAQRDVLADALDEIGWVASVTVNRRTGFVVDGHLRVALAVSRGESVIPVQYVDLDEREEAIALATVDPIGALAGRDQGLLGELVAGIDVGGRALSEMLSAAAQPMGGPVGVGEAGDEFAYHEQFGVTVICKDAGEQERVYDELKEQGYECRVVVV